MRACRLRSVCDDPDHQPDANSAATTSSSASARSEGEQAHASFALDAPELATSGKRCNRLDWLTSGYR